MLRQMQLGGGKVCCAISGRLTLGPMGNEVAVVLSSDVELHLLVRRYGLADLWAHEY